MKLHIKPITLVLCAMLAGGAVAVALLLPGTLDSRRTLEIERAATPMLLKTGVKGDEVTRLQQRLKELGYYNGEVDGQYGPGTAEAVRVFQAQHGLDSDGIAGEATRTRLYAQDAQTCVPTATPTATPSLLKKGDASDAVREMQQRLKELGYSDGEVDGDFGGGTEESVRLYQRQNGLDVDGIAAEKTFASLYSDNARQVTITPTPDPAQMPLLVNREHPVGADYEPDDLVKLKNVMPSSLVTVKGSDIQGDRTAANAMIEMFEAAKGYRSYEYQQELFDEQVAEYRAEGFTQEKAVSATRNTVADPGASEHHTGLAFDITVAGTIFKGTEQQIWLHKHCWDYGFIIRYQEDKEVITGFLAECWHIRYVGLPHSTEMRDRNLCLEEYLGEA